MNSRAADWLRLTRAPLAPTAACDSVACALLARGPGLVAGGAAALAPADALLLAATSVLVYLAGMTLNDWFDRGRDRTLHPERPLPAGRISPAAALAAAMLLAAGALALGGGPAGYRGTVGAALVLALVYDGFAKRRLAPGCLAMGSVRALNAATAVLPLVLSRGTSPLALLAPLLLGLYSAGITAHSTSEDRPQPYPRRLLFARGAAFLAFLGAGVLSVAGAAGMAAGAFFAPAVCLSVAFGRVPRRRPVKAQVLELLLGFYWIDAILATGGAPGSAWSMALAAFVLAYALILSSQLAIRALRPPAPSA